MKACRGKMREVVTKWETVQAAQLASNQHIHFEGPQISQCYASQNPRHVCSKSSRQCWLSWSWAQTLNWNWKAFIFFFTILFICFSLKTNISIKSSPGHINVLSSRYCSYGQLTHRRTQTQWLRRGGGIVITIGFRRPFSRLIRLEPLLSSHSYEPDRVAAAAETWRKSLDSSGHW